MAKKDPLKPGLSLLCKLGSVVVHTEEMLSSKRHSFDLIAIETVLKDKEVREWMTAMGAYLPAKR